MNSRSSSSAFHYIICTCIRTVSIQSELALASSLFSFNYHANCENLITICDIINKDKGGVFLIYVGLTGWGDHPSLYSEQSTTRDKLFDYSGHFPIVEVDTSFYAIPTSPKCEKMVF